MPLKVNLSYFWLTLVYANYNARSPLHAAYSYTFTIVRKITQGYSHLPTISPLPSLVDMPRH